MPIAEPTEEELREVLASAGSLARRQTSKEEEVVQPAIRDYRKEKRRRK